MLKNKRFIVILVNLQRTCEHVDFPSSNKRMVVPFALIHSDVWGSSSIPYLAGTSRFVIFIDDCTRVTWVFLLKEKSEAKLLKTSSK